MITAEIWSDAHKGWRPVEVAYRAGYVELYAGNLYRLTQSPTAPVEPLPPQVIQAVRNLAIYQLIQAPARRKFRSQSMENAALSGLRRGSWLAAVSSKEEIAHRTGGVRAEFKHVDLTPDLQKAGLSEIGREEHSRILAAAGIPPRL